MIKGILIDLGFIELKKDEVYDKNEIYFIHQYHISNIKHHYVADFYFPNINVVIEEDGVWFHKDKIERDNIRTLEMEEAGYRVFRITDYAVLNKYDDVKNEINNFIKMGNA
jgi:very-short-patch-repair endonuclease